MPEGASASAFGCGNPFAYGEVQEGPVVLDLGSGAGIDVILAARRVGPRGRVIAARTTYDADQVRALVASARSSCPTASPKRPSKRPSRRWPAGCTASRSWA